MKQILLSLFVIACIAINRIDAQIWQQVATGTEYTLALNSDGTLWAWGFNVNGQLGIGMPELDQTPVPTQVGTDSDWKYVAAGAVHSVAIKNDGTLWAWGGNGVHQVGNGTTMDQHTPVKISTDTDWKFVACGQAHTLAIKENGTLWSWGFNTWGQVGNGSTTNASIPVQVGVDTDWKSAAGGGGHTLGLKENGNLYAWGANFTGQLGTGNMTNFSLPQLVSSEAWIDISCGFEYSAGIKLNKSMWAWGLNANRQIGDGTTVNRTLPVQIMVPAVSEWTTVSCGSVYALAIASDSTLWAWGANIAGCLGIESMSQAISPPQQVGEDSDWRFISSARGLASGNNIFGFHTMGLKANRDVICVTGANYVGQLGTEDLEQRNMFECSVLPLSVSTHSIALFELAEVFPNPFLESITLDCKIDQTQWKIADLFGKVILAGKTNSAHETLHLKGLNSGVYLLILQAGNNIQTIKIIKS